MYNIDTSYPCHSAEDAEGQTSASLAPLQPFSEPQHEADCLEDKSYTLRELRKQQKPRGTQFCKSLYSRLVFTVKLLVPGVLKAFEGGRYLTPLDNRIGELSPYVNTSLSPETPTGAVQ